MLELIVGKEEVALHGYIYDLPIDDSAVCCYITLINNASWRTRQASRKEAGAEKQAGIAHPGRTQKETKRKGEP